MAAAAAACPYGQTCIDVPVLRRRVFARVCQGRAGSRKASRGAEERRGGTLGGATPREFPSPHVDAWRLRVHMLGEVWYDRRSLLASAGVLCAKHLRLLVGKRVEWDPRPDTQPELCGGHCDGHGRGRKGGAKRPLAGAGPILCQLSNGRVGELSQTSSDGNKGAYKTSD